MSVTQAQVDHIKQHQIEFDDHMGEPWDVEEYFRTYHYIPDLYVKICTALGLKPITEKRDKT